MLIYGKCQINGFRAILLIPLIFTGIVDFTCYDVGNEEEIGAGDNHGILGSIILMALSNN